MNINPKKSWHVRSKTNIAKVKRDEAKVAAEEHEKKRRINLATSDERWSHMKKQARLQGLTQGDTDSEFDLFKDVKRGVDGVVAGNKEYEKEKREDQERWEKKIGLLKQLGEGSAELAAEKPWWTQKRDMKNEQTTELEKSSKYREDPMSKVPNSHQPKKDETKSQTNHQPSQSKSIEQLRKERLEREKREREKTQQLLIEKGVLPQPKQMFPSSANIDDERKRPYNSAYNASISANLQHRR